MFVNVGNAYTSDFNSLGLAHTICSRLFKKLHISFWTGLATTNTWLRTLLSYKNCFHSTNVFYIYSFFWNKKWTEPPFRVCSKLSLANLLFGINRNERWHRTPGLSQPQGQCFLSRRPSSSNSRTSLQSAAVVIATIHYAAAQRIVAPDWIVYTIT